MNAKTISKQMTTRGNAVGFTITGDTVCCQYIRRPGGGVWKIFCTLPSGAISLSDSRNQTFRSKSEAAQYALSLIDEARTRELAWW